MQIKFGCSHLNKTDLQQNTWSRLLIHMSVYVVSNHRQLNRLFNYLFRPITKKTSNSSLLALAWESIVYRWIPHTRASTGKRSHVKKSSWHTCRLTCDMDDLADCQSTTSQTTATTSELDNNNPHTGKGRRNTVIEAGVILGMGSANERRRYCVTPSLIGRAIHKMIPINEMLCQGACCVLTAWSYGRGRVPVSNTAL